MRSFVSFIMGLYDYEMTKKGRSTKLEEIVDDEIINECENTSEEENEELVMPTPQPLPKKQIVKKYDDEDDDDEDEDEDEDEDGEDEEDDDDEEDGQYDGLPLNGQDMFDDSDVDIQEIMSQFFQNSEGENIPDLLNDIRIAVDNNSKCILKVAKELKTMNSLYARKNSH